jgi:hypothetical protein
MHGNDFETGTASLIASLNIPNFDTYVHDFQLARLHIGSHMRPHLNRVKLKI